MKCIHCGSNETEMVQEYPDFLVYFCTCCSKNFTRTKEEVRRNVAVLKTD